MQLGSLGKWIEFFLKDVEYFLPILPSNSFLQNIQFTELFCEACCHKQSIY